MIVRNLKDAENSTRRIVSHDGAWESTRLLLKGDNMGFSFHITTINKGAELHMHYQNHLESVYCISGEGEVELLETGQKYAVQPGTLYALDQNDRHILRAFSEIKAACVFNPPLHGKEVHNVNGSYDLEAEAI